MTKPIILTGDRPTGKLILDIMLGVLKISITAGRRQV